MEKNKTSKESVLATWIFIIILAVYFLIYSLSAFVLIGDQGPPVWNFDIVKDVPGESPEAIYKKLPHPQHVKGKKGE
jgi:nitrate reductase NapE component